MSDVVIPPLPIERYQSLCRHPSAAVRLARYSRIAQGRRSSAGRSDTIVFEWQELASEETLHGGEEAASRADCDHGAKHSCRKCGGCPHTQDHMQPILSTTRLAPCHATQYCAVLHDACAAQDRLKAWNINNVSARAVHECMDAASER